MFKLYKYSLTDIFDHVMYIYIAVVLSKNIISPATSRPKVQEQELGFPLKGGVEGESRELQGFNTKGVWRGDKGFDSQ